MKRILITLLALVLIVGIAIPMVVPVSAASTLEVGPGKAYAHPQDAVNAAQPGDTILVYPGTYGTREAPHSPPHWGPNDWFAPALIVYKDNLTIKAVDPDPANTIIESTHNVWSNPVAIQWSTGGTFHPGPNGWDAYYTTPPGITPSGGSAPNAISIISSNVTITGFTIRRHYEGTNATWNTAGVMIGGLYAGDSANLGSNNNIVQNCVFSDVWHAVYIWHSSGNTIKNNTIAALGNTGHWAGISIYDGYNDSQIGLGHPSENNLICHNTLADKGIALGAWAPPTWTSVAGSKVCCNTTTQVGVTYAHGPVIIGGNTGGFWQTNTDEVIRIKGINYTGTTSTTSPATLSAQLVYDGSSDGSNIPIIFSINGSDYPPTNTITGGSASKNVTLTPGAYTVQAKVVICECSQFTASKTLYVYQPTNFVIWGGNQTDLVKAIKIDDHFMFWGAQWAKQVVTGEYAANSSFKGYADTVTGSTWTAKPGNSMPPATIGNYISVIVATHIDKKGNVISGNIAEIVVLQVDNPSSYLPDPGHPGSGVVVAILP
jgi:parallel beta-helix repeat protein